MIRGQTVYTVIVLISLCWYLWEFLKNFFQTSSTLISDSWLYNEQWTSLQNFFPWWHAEVENSTDIWWDFQAVLYLLASQSVGLMKSLSEAHQVEESVFRHFKTAWLFLMRSNGRNQIREALFQCLLNQWMSNQRIPNYIDLIVIFWRPV